MRFLPRPHTSWRLVFIALLIAFVGGCVEHQLVVETDPDGAIVTMNDQEVGRTPVKREFNWYGTYDVVVRKEGYETLRVKQPIIAPWWQWVPFDLLAEIMPFRITDTQRVRYTLKPTTAAMADPQQMIRRAHELEGKLLSGELTVVKPPNTQPATKPATRRAKTQPTTKP